MHSESIRWFTLRAAFHLSRALEVVPDLSANHTTLTCPLSGHCKSRSGSYTHSNCLHNILTEAGCAAHLKEALVSVVFYRYCLVFKLFFIYTFRSEITASFRGCSNHEKVVHCSQLLANAKDIYEKAQKRGPWDWPPQRSVRNLHLQMTLLTHSEESFASYFLVVTSADFTAAEFCNPFKGIEDGGSQLLFGMRHVFHSA